MQFMFDDVRIGQEKIYEFPRSNENREVGFRDIYAFFAYDPCKKLFFSKWPFPRKKFFSQQGNPSNGGNASSTNFLIRFSTIL